MSMVIDNEKGILKINVPNSEANINAQHYGIKQRTVGSYYLSEKYEECMSFFYGCENQFYIDVLLCLNKAKKLIDFLIKNNYSNFFKNKLKPQSTEIEALKWLIDNGEYFIHIDDPTVNDNKKYLKLDNINEVISSVKTLVLGDLSSIIFKKLGNTVIVYIDKNDNFDNIINNNTILKWVE